MKTGFIGTGLLGLPMARRLLECGWRVTAWNRTLSRLAPLEDAGAVRGESPGAVIGSTDCTILMLSDAAAIREVLFTPEVTAALPGKTIIQMGTIGPAQSRALGAEVSRHGSEYFEAPVLGSIPQASQGTLLVMVGSTVAQFDRWEPLLSEFGPEPVRVGRTGQAAALKLALNQLIASLTAAFSASLGLVLRSGLDVEQFMGILRSSALHAPTFDKKLERMLTGDYANPNFPTEHMLKDVDLFLAEANRLGLEATNVAGVRQVIRRAVKLGLGQGDYSALFVGINPPEEGPPA